jgi:hypothetical protein
VINMIPLSKSEKQQKGGVLMVMLVILVLGITTIFVTALSGTAIQNKRNQTTAESLAKARDALISYAVSDPNRPGELPCPDTDGDGSANSCSAASNKLIGQLPWRTLDLPDPRDGAAEKLWYIVSENFRTDTTAPPPAVNSDTAGTISVNGTNGYAAVILAPGAALPGQNRPAAPTALNTSTVYLQFLENITQTTVATQAPNDIPGGAYTYNDQSLSLHPADFMPLIEKRVVREAKKCLDDYAATIVPPHTTPGNKYPWAAQLSNTTASPGRSGALNVRFGRFPDTPNISTSGTCATGPLSGLSSAQLTTLNDAIQQVQDALNSYTGPGSTGDTLNTAGKHLEDLAENSPYNLPSTNPIRAAGIYVDDYCTGTPKTCTNLSTMQTKLDAAFSEINACTSGTDSTMPASWVSCSLVTSGYWNSWRDLLFIQIANGYQPGGAGSCTTGTTCLSITGSGNPYAGSGTYHAAVAIARGIIPAANTSPRNTATLSDYLEGTNKLNKTGATPSLLFETYRTDDASYGSINDLVLCIDGLNNCKR